ncbi:MAG: hypothetical protein HY073_03760 [Deltaproteobacteria bacterium]|nr:hypothetical protein [Deltaproteobacteria bacterium]
MKKDLDMAAQFPQIEKLLQSEDFEPINKSFTEAYDQLEGLSKGKGGLKKTSDARKAMKGIEKTMDLLRELLEVKCRLAQASPVQTSLVQASLVETGASRPQSKK